MPAQDPGRTPAGALLILIGTNRSRQLPTILSRTQIVRFEPLPQEVVSQLLLEQSVVENESQARDLAAQSGGSLQRATEILAMNLGDFRQRLVKHFSQPGLNSVRFVSMVNDFVSEAGTEAEAKRQRLRATFELVIEHLRDQLTAAKAPVSTNRASDSRLLAALDRCVLAEEELDRNANQATLLECWVDDLSHLLNTAPIPR